MTGTAPLSAPDRTLIMGVLNVTPDSFSDGGRHARVEDAIRHAEALRAEGADLIDVGGESTRPGAEPVPEAEELRRVLPVVEALVERGIGPVSIDTYKAQVARAAVAAGATLINDISGGTFEPGILAVAASSGAGFVLSHARARPEEMQRGDWRYEGGVVAAVEGFFQSQVARAEAAGVALDQIILDPGIGFGKRLDENLELLRSLNRLKVRGRPILVGTSRKSFIGRLTGRAVHEREHGTAATVALSVAAGADMVRVHDVAAMKDVCRVADAWTRGTRLDDET